MKVRKQVKQDTQIETGSAVNTYAIETVVNNLPEALDSLMHKAYQCQDEFSNETDFRVAFMGDSFLAQAKSIARSAVVQWDAAIAKCQKLHKEFNREQAIDYLRKTNSGKSRMAIATTAEAVKTELS